MLKIMDQVNELEQWLWMAAESIGLPKSQKTFDTLMEKFKEPSMFSLESRAPINHEEILAYGFFAISLVRDYGEEGEGMWPVICAVQLAVGIIIGSHPSSNNQVEEALSTALRNTFSKLGKTGSIKRHTPMRELKQWTIAQFRAGAWPSANKAAHALTEKVIEHGKSIDAHLSTENAQRTIAEWIRKSV